MTSGTYRCPGLGLVYVDEHTPGLAHLSERCGGSVSGALLAAAAAVSECCTRRRGCGPGNRHLVSADIRTFHVPSSATPYQVVFWLVVELTDADRAALVPVEDTDEAERIAMFLELPAWLTSTSGEKR